jgi:hypothetical protein
VRRPRENAAMSRRPRTRAWPGLSLLRVSPTPRMVRAGVRAAARRDGRAAWGDQGRSFASPALPLAAPVRGWLGGRARWRPRLLLLLLVPLLRGPAGVWAGPEEDLSRGTRSRRRLPSSCSHSPQPSRAPSRPGRRKDLHQRP